MTGHDDFDRLLAGWFEADALAPAPADALDRVLDVTRRRRPRPAWLAGFGSQWVGEAPDAGSGSGARSLARLDRRWSTTLVLILVIAALVGGTILVGVLLLRPSPLPTGRLGHLAYGLDDGIYVADWDGANPVRITGGPPTDGGPDCQNWGGGRMWSPDGLHLAYRNGCRGTVELTDPEGHPVASFPGDDPVWSPDSIRVAMWLDEPVPTIGIYGLDGVRQAMITLPAEHYLTGEYDPVWSPDGASLLMRLAPPMPSRVWELPIAGGTPRQVPFQHPMAHFDAVYTPDRSRVAFVPVFESFSLVIAQADGTKLRVLAGAGNFDRVPYDGDIYASPAWSPMGDRVAFVWSRGMPYDQAGDLMPNDYELRVVDVASGVITTLVRAHGNSPLRPIEFSPEGDRILFSRADADDTASLWSVRTDGSDAQLLVSGTDWGDWQWQPADH